MRLVVVPCTRDEANAFVEEHHRHNGAVPGHKFAIAVADENGVVHGVAISGRPVARPLNDGFTIEINRVCTDGTKNASSKLYAASWRVAREMGYRKAVTYSHKSEPGTSLVAAGFKVVGEVKGRSWDCKSRPRVDTRPLQDKLRWEVSVG